MSDIVIVGVLSLFGTLVGSLGGILAAAKLTNYKINVLREDFNDLRARVDKHNNLVERMAIVEQSTISAHHRLDGLSGRNCNGD